MSKALGMCTRPTPLPKRSPSQLLLYVKQGLGKTKKKVGGPTKWGSTESLEHSQVSRAREGRGSQRRPRQLAGGARAESQGQPLAAGLRVGGRTQGAAGSPPSRISSAGCSPTLACAHPAEKLRALTRPLCARL